MTDRIKYRPQWPLMIGTAGGGVALIAAITTNLQSYGVLLFVAVPVLIGLACGFRWHDAPPKELVQIAGRAVWVGAILLSSLLLLGLEGIGCIVMAAPLGIGFMLLGACLGWLLFHKNARTIPLLIMLAMSGWTAWDTVKRPVDTQTITTSIVIEVSAEKVWKAVVRLGKLPETKDPFLKYCVACPVTTVITEPKVGGTRLCTLSTGPMPERITVWEPNRRLGFEALSTPPPMVEINPFWKIDPPHQHGYYRVLYGEFKIEPLSDGRTRLSRTTRYESRLTPALYWRLWCDFAAERAHRHVLEACRAAALSSRSARL